MHTIDVIEHFVYIMTKKELTISFQELYTLLKENYQEFDFPDNEWDCEIIVENIYSLNKHNVYLQGDSRIKVVTYD